MKKRKIIFYAISEPARPGVVERYELANVYGFEYIKAFALKDSEINASYDISIIVFPDDVLNEEIVDNATTMKPEMAGFSCSLKNFGRVTDLARQIKLASPAVGTIIGGPQAFAPRRIMAANAAIDYAVIGEGEEVFRDLLLARIRQTGLNEIPGLCYREDGEIIVNKPIKPIGNLDVLPSVVTAQRAAAFSGVVIYETSRGCSHACSYCLWSPYPKRYFNIERVKKDLKRILSNKNVERIWFIDSDFDSDSHRAIEILRFVKDNNRHGQKISAFFSFASQSSELLALVSELFHEVPVGLQTVDTNILKTLGRSWFDLPRFERAIPRILEHIPADRLYIDLMYGLPRETPDAFFESLLWCVRRGLCHINFFRLGIYPGTRIEINAEKYKYVYDPEPPHLVYSSDSFSYHDILKIENVITNFKILSAIFGSEGMRFLENKLDLRSVMENINCQNDDWGTYFTRINESNISDIDTIGLIPIVTGYFRKNLKNERLLKEIERMMATPAS